MAAAGRAGPDFRLITGAGCFERRELLERAAALRAGTGAGRRPGLLCGDPVEMISGWLAITGAGLVPAMLPPDQPEGWYRDLAAAGLIDHLVGTPRGGAARAGIPLLTPAEKVPVDAAAPAPPAGPLLRWLVPERARGRSRPRARRV